MHMCIYMYFFIYFFFSSYNVRKHVRYHVLISCQPGVITVSVTQGGTATPDATKQLLPPDRVLRELYIYIYTPYQFRAETTLDVNLHFQCAVCDFKKNHM